MPALAAWMPSPIPGAISTSVVSASEAISSSDCPTPVSMSTTSQPAASSTRSACGVAQASPPRCPREAIDRMYTPLSPAWSCIRTRSPSSAPRRTGTTGRRRARRRACRRHAARARSPSSTSTCRRPGIPSGRAPVRDRCAATAPQRPRAAPGSRPRPARSAGPPTGRRHRGRPPTSVGTSAARRPRRPAGCGRRLRLDGCGGNGRAGLGGDGKAWRAHEGSARRPGHRRRTGAAAPTPPPRRPSSRARCSAIRAPLALPTGWPRAIAPPLTLTLSGSRPSSRVETMPTAAKASLISTRSRSGRSMPSRSQAFAIARDGWVCSVASGPATTPCAPISASGVRPSSAAFSALITTTAQARRRSATRSRP